MQKALLIFTFVFFVWVKDKTIKILNALLLLSLYFQDTLSMQKHDQHDLDKLVLESDRDAATLVAEGMLSVAGFRCRDSAYNLTYELTDAVYHCLNVDYKKMSRIKFSKEKADLSGPSGLSVSLS
jgi:hypothetical protein